MGVSSTGEGPALSVADEVQRALHEGRPVVALESALITHGLPFPTNMNTALDMQREAAAAGATPATVAVLDGEIRIGVTEAQIRRLAESKQKRKIGIRDLASASMGQASGGTTVAATMFAASKAGIEVFATGGIGGVHRENAYDISADIAALGGIRMIVVCAGAKAVLDLAATLEVLESLSVPVVGYGTDEFPAFYSRGSSLQTSMRVDSPEAAAQYWIQHCRIGMECAVLVANPIPAGEAIPAAELAGWIQQASADARNQRVSGQALTPFLLGRIGDLSEGRTIRANIALLLNNARLAGKIAEALSSGTSNQETTRP